MKPISPKHKKIGFWILVLIAGYTILGFFILPPLIKQYTIKKLSATLHREVHIRKVKFNPYTFVITVNDFEIKERGKPDRFIAFDQLYLDFQLISIFKKGYVFREIKLEKPYLNLVRNLDLTYNFSDLLLAQSAKPANKKPKEYLISLNNIQISDGIINFDDTPKKTIHHIEQLDLNLPFISNLPTNENIFVQPSFSARINNSPVKLGGKAKPFASSRETEFEFNFDNINIPYYLAYTPIKMDYKLVTGSANFRTSLSFVESTTDNTPSLIFHGSIALRDIGIQDLQSNPMMTVPYSRLEIKSGDVFRNQWHLNEITVSAATVEVIRDKTGKFNLEVLKPKTEKKSGLGSTQIDIDTFRIENARIGFKDFMPAVPFRTIIEPLDFKADYVSTSTVSSARYQCSLKTKENEEIDAAGNFIAEAFSSQGTIKLTGIPIKKYATYYQDKIRFDVQDGKCQMVGNYSYAHEPAKPILQFSAVTVMVDNLKLKKRIGQPDFVTIPKLIGQDIAVDVLDKKISIKEINSSQGKLIVERYPTGQFSFDSLVNLSNHNTAKAVSHKNAKPGPQWLAKVDKIAIDRYAINWADQVPTRPANINITDLKLNIANYSNATNSRARVGLSCQLDKKGVGNASGWLTLNPIVLQSNLALQNLELSLLQPYVEDRLKILITSGYANVTGAMVYRTNRNGTPSISYTGQAVITDFVSKEKQTGEDFLKWNSVAVNGIEFKSAPLNIYIHEMGLTDFYSKVMINADSTVNLTEIIEAKKTRQLGSTSTTKPVAETTNQVIKIDRITLNKGRIDFTDKSITPTYTTQFSDLTCQITGLTSEDTTTGDITLSGKIDNYASIQITGKINPLHENLYADLKIEMKNLDLNSLSPFSGRYVGYKIEKGKLYLDGNYLVDKRKLDSKNTVFLDQLDFGDRVDSPEAVKLPIKLGVALLKDFNGQIHLDIPVSGSLDDPKFRVRMLIPKIITDVFSKVVTSPFSLLGAILGGNAEEFSYLEFDPGSYQINDPNLKKLDKLVEALVKRPGLQLDISGYVDLDKDREGLRELTFSRKLKSEKLQELIKKGEPDRPLDQVAIDQKEYERYLTIVYKNEKFPKEKDALGFTKTLPIPEMEKLIREHIIISDDDLKQFASDRTKSVEQYIISTGKVKPERIFLTEPKQLVPEKKEKLSYSRVEFKLK